MNIQFDDKVVIVTGASTGIGQATALEFGRSGAKLVVNYFRSKAAAEAVVAQIESDGSEAIAVKADVTKAGDVNRLVNETLDTFGGKIDVLVNNAGALIERRLLKDMSEELWDTCMELNVKSVYLCSQAVLPAMKKNKFGRIINVSSIAARTGGSVTAGHYSAAKAAVLTLTKNLAKEVVKEGIIVNGVAPGVIDTPFQDKFTPANLREGFQKVIPAGREGTSEEIAYAILFLASEYASYIVGETIEINGGMLMD